MASFTQLLDTTPENSAAYLADFSAAVRPDQLYCTVLYCTVLQVRPDQRADRMFALLDR